MDNILYEDNRLFKIAIIEDSEIHREWLHTELMDHPNFTVISVSGLGRDGIEAVKTYKPDLVILDLFLIFLGKHFFRKCTLIRSFID